MGDFTSINRNWNIKSRIKLLSQLVCMKLIAQLKEQFQTYMGGAEIRNRLILNNFIFLLTITGKFYNMREEKVANYFHLPFLWLYFSFLKAQEKQTCLYLPFFISFLLLSAHPPPLGLQYVLVQWFYTWLLYITEDLMLQIKTLSSGRNHALRLQVSNPVCLFS